MAANTIPSPQTNTSDKAFIAVEWNEKSHLSCIKSHILEGIDANNSSLSPACGAL